MSQNISVKLKISLHLLDVLRQIYGWIKNEEKEKIV